MTLSDLNIPKCKKFTGYKPCIPYKKCFEEGCQENTIENQIGIKILVISLDALGAVLSHTSILLALKRKFPVSTIYWVILENAKNILLNNPYIDRLFFWTDEHRMILRNIEFDYVLNADKSEYACSFANEVKGKNKLGFLLNENGKIIPANEGAFYNYRMGNDDHLKFRLNKRTGIDIIHETFELEYKVDEYIFEFTNDELDFIEVYKKKIKHNPKKIYVGFNTGCSNLFPNKKMTIEQHIKLIRELLKDKKLCIVLLGGKEDTERNNQILKAFSKSMQKKIISTPTELGIRKGACFMNICDIIITGDSFGMHLAIALKKYVIAWFGLSCWTEIELFGRGEKLIPRGLECSPCWKKVCPHNLECIKAIDLKKIIVSVKDFYKKMKATS